MAGPRVEDAVAKSSGGAVSSEALERHMLCLEDVQHDGGSGVAALRFSRLLTARNEQLACAQTQI
eukprot:15451584-Alexandrium_andersonii.AAC.1